MAEKPLVYLVLGAAGSGRREVLADLIDGELGEADRAAVLLAEGEAPDAHDAKLARLSRWKWTGAAIEATLPPDATHVFLITDGRSNPIDQLEAAKAWIPAQGAELGRVLCVVNCQLAEKHPPLLAWFDACVHFTDVVLLNRRDGVSNKWLSDFQTHFKSKFMPCLFEFVKGGHVKNPALVLDPQARRMSHAFDEEQDWIFTTKEGEEIDEDEEAEGDDDVEVTAAEDEYFERLNGGRRVKEIPVIAKYLES